MSKKFIYLVRHGESEGNIGLYRQGPTSPLTERGIKQAEIVANRCVNLPIDLCITSTMMRAQQTADIISNRIGKTFEKSDLFIERLRPSVQFGMAVDSSESKEIDKILLQNFIKPNARIADEEIFEDLNSRAEKALDSLKNKKENHILVVTHGLFLRVIVGKVIFGNDLTGSICDDMFRALRTENTGISVIIFDEEKQEWLLKTWNDHAHLAEPNQ